MKKNNCTLIFFSIIIFYSIIGCSNINKSSLDNEIYLKCNETSNGKMAEIESGFFFAYDYALYYADRDNLDVWNVVCNKPYCTHGWSDTSCNAYLPSYNSIVQKDGKLYCVDEGYGKPYVYEIAMDGNGLKKVYEIPIETNEHISSIASTVSQEQLVVYYTYLAENGMNKHNMIYLKDNMISTLYSTEIDYSVGSLFMNANIYWSIRGDDIFLSSLLAEQEQSPFNSIWKVDNGILEQVKIPEDILLYANGAYLSDNIFTYFKKNEGFYQLDLETGKQTLLYENQLEDSRAYMFNEQCIVEYNWSKDFIPEQAYMKFYNGEKWITVEVLDEVVNTDSYFSPRGVASDRIFFEKYVNGSPCLYYFMLEDDMPKLTYAGRIEKLKTEEESSEECSIEENMTKEEMSSSVDSNDFKEVIVFDNEDLLLKITDASVQISQDEDDKYYNQEVYVVDLYMENKSLNSYFLYGNYCAINGIQCDTAWGRQLKKGEVSESSIFITMDFLKDYDGNYIYDFTEYTNIELIFSAMSFSENKFGVMEEKIVHIYPYEEERVIFYERELQTSDQVLIDDECVMAVVVGYDKTIVSEDTIKMYFVNKTNKSLAFKIEDAYINGKQIPEDGINALYDVYISGGKCAIEFVSLVDSKFLNENGITSIEEIKFTLRAYPCDYGHSEIGEDIVHKTFILNP